MKDIVKNKKLILVFLIIVIGIVVRIYNFPNVIAEVNCDEMITAANAKTISETGKDFNGISFPVYLQAWGGQSVVLVYLMAITVKIFGYTLFAIRLPLLIISIISMFIFFDFVKKLSKNEYIAIIALVLLAISPWHICQSVWALDCNMFPHFLLFAMDIFYTGIIKNKNSLVYISMIFFGITLYCYGLAIYFTPLFLVVAAIYLYKKEKISLKAIIISIAIFLIIAMPIIIMFAINLFGIKNDIIIGKMTIPYYEHLTRTSDMLFFSENGIIKQLFMNIGSMLAVVILQNDLMPWNTSPIFGTIYLVSIVFMVFSLIDLIKHRNEEKYPKIILIWIVISMITGIIANGTNVNRINSIWYPLIILTSFGIYNLYEFIKYKKEFKYITISVYVIAFISYFIYFNVYYSDVISNSNCFSRGFYASLNYIDSLEQKTVYFENTIQDRTLLIYVEFHNEEKEYISLEIKEDVEEKLKNLKDTEVMIVNNLRYPEINVKNKIPLREYTIVIGE